MVSLESKYKKNCIKVIFAQAQKTLYPGKEEAKTFSISIVQGGIFSVEGFNFNFGAP